MKKFLSWALAGRSQWKVLIDFSCGIHKGWRRHSNATKKTDELFYRLLNKRALWKIISHHSIKKEKSSENIPSFGSSWILAPVRKQSRSHLLSDALNLFDLGHTLLPPYRSMKAKPISVACLRMEGSKNSEIPAWKPLWMTLDTLSVLLISYWGEGSRL